MKNSTARRVAVTTATREEFTKLTEDWHAWGLPLARYSRMLQLAKRIARVDSTTVDALLA